MNKILIKLFLFAGLLFGGSAVAQSGLNNNSNWKTPIPNTVLPSSPTSPNTGPGNVIVNPFSIQTPPVPSIPSLAGLNLPTSIPNINLNNLIPAMPVSPPAPAMPSPAFVASMAPTTPMISLPVLPILPPVAPITPVPELRLVVRP